MEEAHALVRESLKSASARSKRYYDLDVKSRQIVPGSWVWFYSPRRYVGRSPKRQINYSGPFLVIRQLSPVLYAIQKSRRAKECIVHGDKLKPYLGKTPDTWLSVEECKNEPGDSVERQVEGNRTTSLDNGHSPPSADVNPDDVNPPGGGCEPIPAPSKWSPLAVEFRPKRQIRLPQRYL